MDPSLGLYISIPFCRAKCTYCNFASGVFPASEHQRYIARLCADLRAAQARAARERWQLPHRLGSIYLGGGTPSTLEPHLLGRLFAAIREQFAIDPRAEITVECAPGQIAPAFLEAMLQAGVTRVSLGVQSMIDAEAAATGRAHTRAIVEADVHRLRCAGLAVNIDLIAGLPGQTVASWRESVDAVRFLGVEHASLYMLEVDEDSRLGRELIGGGRRYGAGLVPADDAIAAMYEEGCARLEQSGLAQYEISNFAAPASESRHNLRYWLRQPYLGIGLDAHSMLHTLDSGAVRLATPDELSAYMDGEPGSVDVVELATALEEAWFLGLRLNRGVSLLELSAEFGHEAVAAFDFTLAECGSSGLLQRAGNCVALTRQGRLLSNEVFSRFLGVTAPEASAVLPR